MEISLPPDIERALAEQAGKQGTTPERLALDSLRRQFAPSDAQESPTGGATLADFLGEHIGVIHSSEHVPGGAQMSEDPGKKFAAGQSLDRKLSGDQADPVEALRYESHGATWRYEQTQRSILSAAL